ncbi:leucine carboxyl methyltransferase [Parastagonospora nodorum]|nr:leucine carboxyl methyltransferase [Parastagonospora nodorum]KAH4012664.1 leucine carboxyl methyltransferase [Parastagonospora nodorum]KAH4112536.1 leucine carboxyl methyltransferase [Parastagonospora nodorum]KAH4184918.1 leucine carboxyl methyltransferase [Parastagonospora nodorum]KAH4343207.1 leucine carboxyl methyltransferase [Parastagonospora nodorum]
MKPRNGPTKRKNNVRSKREKRDDDVMNTNDSSIVSKRCVSKLYFSNEPDYYEPFAPKYVRRNPLINRGYWLRMHAIEQAVLRFLEKDNGKPKVVVNLGCGYDPLPFQFWHRYPALTKHVTFVDVDYPQLMERKRDRMLTNGLLRDALLKTQVRSSELPVYLRSDRYMAIGCDLRHLGLLEKTLRAELDVPSSSVLFVAEVSATYMPVADSDALIRWASTLEDARFCILEQYLPQGPDHPFAKTMLAHFKKLQASIHAIERYLPLQQHSSRFTESGWPSLEIARNLWDLWSDDSFTPPAVRRQLDLIEPFDEWEEFALYGGHYFLLVASNAELRNSTETSGTGVTTNHDEKTNGAEEINLLHIEIPADDQLTPRRFASAFRLDAAVVAIHGGQGQRTRLSSVDVLTQDNKALKFQPSFSQGPSARMCHTVTSIDDRQALLVGGRGSPTQAFNDCWLTRDGVWTKVDDLATARYRHSSVPVRSESDVSEVIGVLVFGGKTSDGTALADWTFWTANNGWHSIPVDGDGPHPSPRFGAAMSMMGTGITSGLLVGGMCQSGTVLQDVWEWTISITPTLRLTFKDRTNDLRGVGSHTTYARIGASLVPWDNSLLLIGGVSKFGIHSLSEDFLLLTPSSAEINIRQPVVPLPSTWPLLVGMGVVAVSRDEFVIAGGGAVCFSMGSFWNDGYLTVTKAGVQGMRMWRKVPLQVDGTAQAKPPGVPHKGQPIKAKRTSGLRTAKVPRIHSESAEAFEKLVAAAKPVIIEGLDIGPCTDLWTLDYLKVKIGVERELVVHECNSDRMTFKDKNFQYVKRTTGEFLDGIAQGTKSYLRAVSSSQPNKLPTKLEDDFPEIAADVKIPEIFDAITPNIHSSPLRISGPVSLWLHYDVLSNILCQIRGTKTLHLYPPSDVKYLDYPPGGSSSNTDVLASKDPKLRFTHPHIASLKPGDILFIPPMWSHTATPDEGVSVAVNVFWRGLDKGYAAGKDVYGNRDLQAYENGRRDVEKIVRAFRDVPSDIAKFYLDRLALEIEEGAGKIGKKGRSADEGAGEGK